MAKTEDIFEDAALKRETVTLVMDLFSRPTALFALIFVTCESCGSKLTPMIA
ncbi:MAG TPA: hypothetical protein VFO40_17380 [Chthoniobacterales bacterium]|nr:hypothetical protein [Chthoniobacterales bacterium]